MVLESLNYRRNFHWIELTLFERVEVRFPNIPVAHDSFDRHENTTFVQGI